jgi:hypothetical protein
MPNRIRRGGDILTHGTLADRRELSFRKNRYIPLKLEMIFLDYPLWISMFLTVKTIFRATNAEMRGKPATAIRTSGTLLLITGLRADYARLRSGQYRCQQTITHFTR